MAEKQGFFDLTEVNELIDKEQELTEQEAYLARCPVDLSELRRYAMGVEDCNPLWFEQEYAKNTKWKGVIAPPTFMHTCGGGSALSTKSYIPESMTGRMGPFMPRRNSNSFCLSGWGTPSRRGRRS